MRIESIFQRRCAAVLAVLVTAALAIYFGARARDLGSPDTEGKTLPDVVLDRGLLEHMRTIAHYIAPVHPDDQPSAEDAAAAICKGPDDRAKFDRALGRLQATLAGLERKAAYRLDVAEWLGDAAAPSCADAVRALNRLASRGLLERASWTEVVEGRGSRGRVVNARIDIPDHLMAEANPWRDPAGCVFAQGLEGEQPVRYLVKGSPRLCAAALSAREGSTVVQGMAEPLRQLHSALVPALHTFVNPLAQLTDAASAPAGNAMRMRGHDLRIGYHAELTFEPAVQAVAQAVAGCLSGTAPCAGLRSATDLDVLRALYEESAIVRRIGVAMVNARGEILAMASAHTPCWEREMRGFAASETCPRAELAGDRNTWQAGTNHAEQEGGVASMAKLALLGALVESGQVGRAHALQDVIRHAATSAPNEWFEGLATCAGSRTRGAADCDMAQRYIRVARGLGWQTGSFDILFGRPLSPGTDLPGGARPAFLVRALVKQANGSLVAMAPEREGAVLAPYRLFASARQMVQAGHLAPSRLAAWVGSHGVDYEAYVRTRDLALNAIGHGDSRGSPVGIAWTMANLAAMARGQSGIRYPHLVLRAVDAQGRTVEPRRFGVEPTVLQPVLSPAKARQLLEILGYVASGRHGGTAAHAYTQVYGTACAGACVVGKTGTLANEPVKGIALLSSYRGEPVGIAVTVERGLLKGARDSANRAALGAFVLTRTMQEVLQASH